jgi:hypothetical protein
MALYQLTDVPGLSEAQALAEIDIEDTKLPLEHARDDDVRHDEILFG